MQGKEEKARRRGKAFEYRVRDWFRRAGFHAERVPVSGIARALKGDIVVEIEGQKLFFETKCRTGGLRQLTAWMDQARKEGAFALILGVGPRRPFVIMEIETFLTLLKSSVKSQQGGPDADVGTKNRGVSS